MDRLGSRNNTSFQHKLNVVLANMREEKDDPLQYHQRIVHDYLLKSNARGILVKHGLGSGKTILAVSICEGILGMEGDEKKGDERAREETNYRVIVMASKSLHENMKKGIGQYLRAIEERRDKSGDISDAFVEKHIAANYKFISSNASNMLKQVNKAVMDEVVPDDPIFGVPDHELDGTLLVVDEAHDLFNSIANGSKNAVSLYEKVMRARDVKLVFLTGYPIVNDPYELAICYNMLSGVSDVPNDALNGSNKSKPGRTRRTLFAENYEVFRRMFVGVNDEGAEMIKNPNRFAERITGLTSSYLLKDPKHFPTVFPLEVVRVPMSRKQFAMYAVARKREIEEGKKKFVKIGNPMFKPGSSGGSSYYVLSRQLCNAKFPEGTYEFTKNEYGGFVYDKHIEQITDADVEDISEWGPKIDAAVDIIASHTDGFEPANKVSAKKASKKRHKELGCGMVYSQFKTSGILLIARTLEFYGMTQYTGGDEGTGGKRGDEKRGSMNGGREEKKSRERKKDHDEPRSKRYAIISGDIPVEERARILEVFDSDENIRGDVISVLLVTGTGAQGLDTQNLRYVIAVDPYWHWARIHQVIGRGDRYKGHERLPPDERTMRPYILLSDYPVDEGGRRISSPLIDAEVTIDEKLYRQMIDNRALNESFLSVLEDASIDCSVWSKTPETCKVCKPTDKILFTDDMIKDIYEESPCEKPDESAVEVRSVEVEVEEDGKKVSRVFKYDDVNVYYYDEGLGGYVKLSTDDEVYALVREMVG